MNFKRYFEKIKNKDEEPKRESKIVKEIEQNVVRKVNVSIKKTLNLLIMESLTWLAMLKKLKN